MQNLYVINSGLRKSKRDTFKVVLAIILFDIALAMTCFYGVGGLLEKSYYLKQGVFLIGGIAITIIGVKLIKDKVENTKEIELDESIIKVIMASFLVTWANPQAVIDGSLLLGGYRALVPLEYINMFIIGVCLASFTWFSGLATVTIKFRKSINTKVIKKINIVCGIVIILYGARLGYSFIQNLNI